MKSNNDKNQLVNKVNYLPTTNSHILIVGTPGVGKSTFAKSLRTLLNEYSKQLPEFSSRVYKVLEVSKLISKYKLYHKKRDDRLNCTVFNTNKVYKLLNNLLNQPSNIIYIVDFHSMDPLDPSWFKLCIHLRANTHTLFDRLEARQYVQTKIKENIECEIFNIIGDELSSFNFSKTNILSLHNDTYQQLEDNLYSVVTRLICHK